MSERAQSFESHARMVPVYHYLGSVLLLVSLVYFGVRTATDFSLDRLMFMVVLAYIAISGFYARLFPLGVQDRVIRLEERLRLQRVLPPEMREDIPRLTMDQLIGLRFAPDEELPELTRRVLGGELTGRKEIKAAVGSWRADHARI